MKTVFGKDAEKEALTEPHVSTVGMFDGVHLGHQKTISTAVDRARALGCGAAVVTFDRHPAAVLSGAAPPLITSLRHRLTLFEALRPAPALCLVLHFDRALAATSARDFLLNILVGMLGAKAVVLGEDSTFGAGSEGNIDFVRRAGAAHGLEAHCVPLVHLGDRAVSSTAVRQAIGSGDLASAEAMLGRRVSLLGTVIHGDQLGAQIGYPTANLDLHHELRPPRGVYAGAVTVGDTEYDAVMNIGVRPTVGDALEERVEVHLIGFDGDLRGRDLEVRLLAKLRDEQSFPSIQALSAQIQRDCEAARRVRRKG